MQVTEILELSDVLTKGFLMIPLGFGLGCLPMIVGAAIHGIFRILKEA